MGYSDTKPRRAECSHNIVVVDRTVQNVVAGSTPATLVVAPLVATFQRAYNIAMLPQIDDGTQRRRRTCYYDEPDSDKFAHERGGLASMKGLAN